jgi:predicted O-linked N-acetylglucosamine transferase (SPINDLY family)
MKDAAQTVPNFVMHSQQEYYDYMENAEQHDFSLNSFPFGGYNTIVESLYLGLPVVTLEGDRFYNRAAAHLLRQIGMPELIANTPQEFVNISTELVLNKTKLAEYRQALADMDLKAKLFTLEGDYFKQAIDYMIAKHPFNETVKLG